jgi:superfamily II DNA/RNA helicase
VVLSKATSANRVGSKLQGAFVQNAPWGYRIKNPIKKYNSTNASQHIPIRYLKDEPISFSELSLSAPVIHALRACGYRKPTEIQSKVIPRLLNLKESALICSETGGGKTLAYILPLVEEAARSKATLTENTLFALILVPNVVLQQQVSGVICWIANEMGLDITIVRSPFETPFASSSPSISCCITTPGALSTQIQHGCIKDIFKQTRIVVFDEIDQLLSGGFEKDTKHIIQALAPKLPLIPARHHPHKLTKNLQVVEHPYPRSPQMIFAGASTYFGNNEWPIAYLLKTIPSLRIIESSQLHRIPTRIEEYFLPVHKADLDKVMLDTLSVAAKSKFKDSYIYDDIIPESAIHFPIWKEVIKSRRTLKSSNFVPLVGALVFCSTGKEVISTANMLRLIFKTWNILEYHVDLSLKEKSKVLSELHRFQATCMDEDSVPLLLVTTDSLSRGLDIPKFSHILHYAFPSNAMIYLHRVGRVGRSTPGVSVLFASEEDQELAIGLHMCSIGLNVNHPYEVFQRLYPQLELPQKHINQWNQIKLPKQDPYNDVKLSTAYAPLKVENWTPREFACEKAPLTGMFSRARNWRAKLRGASRAAQEFKSPI